MMPTRLPNWSCTMGLRNQAEPGALGVRRHRLGARQDVAPVGASFEDASAQLTHFKEGSQTFRRSHDCPAVAVGQIVNLAKPWWGARAHAISIESAPRGLNQHQRTWMPAFAGMTGLLFGRSWYEQKP